MTAFRSSTFRPRGALLAPALAALSLAACTTVTDAPAGGFALGEHEVTLGREWSDVAIMMQAPKGVHVLSVDGPWLDRFYLTEGLSPGEPLVRAASREHPNPVFRADMSPQEQVEFVSDSVAALGYVRVETKGLRPATFAGAPAVRFDLVAATKEGLDISGTGETVMVNGKLKVMLYLAPREHYYASLLPEVESVMRSARVRS